MTGTLYILSPPKKIAVLRLDLHRSVFMRNALASLARKKTVDTNTCKYDEFKTHFLEELLPAREGLMKSLLTLSSLRLENRSKPALERLLQKFDLIRLNPSLRKESLSCDKVVTALLCNAANVAGDTALKLRIEENSSFADVAELLRKV